MPADAAAIYEVANIVLKIGHRGAAGYVAENSLASFEKAISLGVDFIEFDVQATKDGVPIVFHDKNIERMTSEHGFLCDYTCESLKANVMLKGIDEGIPSLEEVCDFFVDKKIKLYVDIKKFGIEKKVVKTLAGKLPKDRFVLGSLYHGVIREIKGLDIDIKTVAIMEDLPISAGRIIEYTACDYLSLQFDIVTPEIVEECHKLSREIFVWTVDEKKDIDRMKTLGVDGIVSNFPDRI